jgi:Zn-dependent M28 family amino/carboxypeptidase
MDEFTRHRIVRVTLLCLAAIAAGTANVAHAQTPTGDPTPAKPEGAPVIAPTIAERYAAKAERIIKATLAGNDSWNKMEELCDDIGHRISGSPELQRAVEWAAERLRRDGAANVRLERVMVPHWVRGRESLTMLEPREQPLVMIGLGMSVGTPQEGITAPVIVVVDEEDLEARAADVAGKIVLFNNAMPAYTPEGGSHYGQTVRFRGRGPRLAAEKGAVACLVRSVTAHSLQTPHTGATSYRDANVRIPAAAVTPECAEMIHRLQKRNIPVRLNLKMEAKTLPDAPSANVIGELVGREKPEEIVVIGGHIDSWDAGQGAHDDGTGCVIAMEAINVLRKLDLIPRRTIRVVLWTNEENGLQGARAYRAEHADELSRHVAAIESDGGGFRPTGFSLDCSAETREKTARDQLEAILGLCGAIGPLQAEIGGSGADVGPMKRDGVLLMGHLVDGAKYFDYHHSPADTLDKVDPTELSQNVAVMAVAAYVIADMEERLGGEPIPTVETYTR